MAEEKKIKIKKLIALIIAIALFVAGLYVIDIGGRSSNSALLLTFLSGYLLAARHKIGGKKE